MVENTALCAYACLFSEMLNPTNIFLGSYFNLDTYVNMYVHTCTLPAQVSSEDFYLSPTVSKPKQTLKLRSF